MSDRPRKGDAAFGPVCRCGAVKAKQAWTCQRCHGRIRGYRRVRGLVGDESAALIVRDRALREARENATGELAGLVAEQATDERLGHMARQRAGWVVSLDGADRNGRPLHEVLAA